MPLGASDAADVVDEPRQEHHVQQKANAAGNPTKPQSPSQKAQPQVHGGHAGAAGQGKQPKPDQSAGTPPLQPQPQVKPSGNPIFDALGLPFHGLSPETAYEIGRGAAATWSHLINPQQREPFLATASIDRMHSRMMQKVHDTFSTPQPAPNGNQTVPPGGQMTPDQTQQSAAQSLSSSLYGAQVMSLIPGSIQTGAKPLTPEQQRESDMHNGLMQFFNDALNAPGEGISWLMQHSPTYHAEKDPSKAAGVSPDDPNFLAAGFYLENKPKDLPEWGKLTDAQKREVDSIYRKWAYEQVKGPGIQTPMEIPGQLGEAMGLTTPQGAGQQVMQSLTGEADPVARTIWNATRPPGDPDWDQASPEDKQQFMAVLALSGLKIGEAGGAAGRAALMTKHGAAVSRVAWAHLAATVAAGRKLPGVDRVVSRILPGADAVDRHMAKELNVVSGARRERSPQLEVDPKKGPLENALDIPPAENIKQRLQGGKQDETFNPLQHLSGGELIDRASKMPEKTQKEFFKKMGVDNLDQFRRMVEGKRMSSAQVDWLSKRWKSYFPYDLRRVDPAEVDLRDPRQHLDTLPDENKVNGQEFLAATHGLLSEVMTGPFGSSGAMAGSLMRSLLGVQRGTSATFQRWQETMTSFLAGHENLGELERKSIEGDQKAYEQLSSQQKMVVDAHRMLEATIRKAEAQWGARKDHVPNFFPRRFQRPVGGRASTAGAKPGVGPLVGKVTAHREEVFQVETPQQAQERIDGLTHEREALQETLTSVHEQLAEFDAKETKKGGPGYEVAKQARNLQRNLKRIEQQIGYSDPQFILQQRFQTVEEANAAIKAQRDAYYEELVTPQEDSGQIPMDEVKARQRADEAYPSLETNYYKVAPNDLVRRIQALHAHQAVNQLENTIIEDKGQQLQAAYRGTPGREMQDILSAHGFRSLNWGAMRDVQWHPVMADLLDRAHALQSMPKGKAERALRSIERAMIGKIMYSPMIHGMNVAGRVGWFMVANPIATAEQVMNIIGASRKQVFDRRTWIEDRRRDAYNAGVLPHTSSAKYGSEFYEGMSLGTGDAEGSNAPGYADLSEAPARVQGSPLAGVLGLGRAVGKGYEALNNVFWSRVNDFGTQLAYPVEYQKAVKSGLDESTARLYAADRANAWMGMVRPERWMPFAHELSRLVFFAPNWWRTYGELATGYYDKTGLVKNGALRSHIVKNEIRTLMAMWIWQHVSGNALNMLLAGHPQWENQPGNQDRLELDHFFPVDPNTGAHMTLEPFLSRQTYAGEKALGLESGHPGWNVEDVPGGMAQEVGGRLSPLASALGDVANIDLYQSFAKGQLYRVDPKTAAFHPGASGMLSALSTLVPFAPGFDVTRGLETIATKGGGPDEALGIPGTGNTQIPKNIKDLLGKGAERFLLGLIGINPPYPYAERSRGQNLSQDELIKVKDQQDQYYGRLQQLGLEMSSGKTTPQDALKVYHDLTTAYHGFLSAEFQSAPYYTHGALGLYHAWEDTYRQATGGDGQIDWAKLDDLQAKFEQDHSGAEMSAIHSFSAKTQTKAPFLRIYHDTIDAYRSFQQQQATQLGISITDLRRFTSQYGALFNDQRASAQFLRQHPQLREYEQAKREWEVSTNAGLMYGLFYNTGTVVRWLHRHGMTTEQLLQQVAGQGTVAPGGPNA